MRWIFVLALVTACDEDLDCDPSLHHLSLQTIDVHPEDLVDTDDYAVFNPRPTAVGGTQHLDAEVFDDCGTRHSNSPVTVRSDDPASLSATAVSETEIEVAASRAGTTRIHVAAANGLTRDASLEAKPIQNVILAARELGAPEAYLQGSALATIVLLDDTNQPLIDRSLEAFGMPALAWNELDISHATVGDHDIQLIAGQATWPFTLTIVDSIDAIVAGEPTISGPTYLSTDACFFAHRAGHVVAGVPWKLVVDRGGFQVGWQPNCITVWQDNSAPPTITVTASALGHSATTVVTFTTN